jgi:ZIP family zinc transporter
MSGLITAIGIALHNFPEGVAVFLASMKSHAVGASLAFAIALHNVPEGVAVALPVYFATGSRMRGFLYAAVSGLAEPLAVVVLALLFPSNLDKQLVEKLLAAVGGIMAFLALSELLPLALEHAGRQAAIISLFLGMAIMSANLFLLDHWMGHDH